MEKNDVGQRIKYAREYRKMTRTQVARAMGITYRGYTYWERGVRNPKIEAINKIASVLNILPAYFLEGEHFQDPIERITPYLLTGTEDKEIIIEPCEALINSDLKKGYIKSRVNLLSENELDDVIKLLNRKLQKKK